MESNTVAVERTRASIAIAVWFTAVGGLPLFLVTCYTVTLQAEFGFDAAELGIIVGTYFTGAVTGAQAGFIVDRASAAVGLRVAGLLSSASGVLIGLAAQSWQAIAIFLFVCGGANSVAQLSLNRMLAGLSRRGLGLGIKQAAAPFTGVLAGVIVSIVGAGATWRVVFVGCAVVTASTAWLLPSRLPAERRPGARPPRSALGRSRAHLLCLAGAGALGGAAANSLALLGVDSLSKNGFAEGEAVALLALANGVAVLARIGLGFVLDRLAASGYRVLTGMMLAGAGMYLVLSAGMASGGNRGVIVAGLLAAFATGWGWPAIIYFVAVETSPVPPATSTGMIMTGVFIGTLLGAPIIAYIAQIASYSAAWAAAAMVSALAAGLVHLSRRVAPAHVARLTGPVPDPMF